MILSHSLRLSQTFSLPKTDFNRPYRRIGKTKEVLFNRSVEVSSVEVFDFKEVNKNFKASDFTLENLKASGSLEALSLPKPSLSAMKAADAVDFALNNIPESEKTE